MGVWASGMLAAEERADWARSQLSWRRDAALCSSVHIGPGAWACPFVAVGTRGVLGRIRSSHMAGANSRSLAGSGSIVSLSATRTTRDTRNPAQGLGLTNRSLNLHYYPSETMQAARVSAGPPHIWRPCGYTTNWTGGNVEEASSLFTPVASPNAARLVRLWRMPRLQQHAPPHSLVAATLRLVHLRNLRIEQRHALLSRHLISAHQWYQWLELFPP